MERSEAIKVLSEISCRGCKSLGRDNDCMSKDIRCFEAKKMAREFRPMEHDEVVSHVKAKIKEKGISQKELAEKVGITVSAMSRYLNFNRTMPFDIMSKCLAEVGDAFVVINLADHGLALERRK